METSEYGYRFLDPENRKILRHKDVIFNAKIYKDLLTKKNTSEKDPKVAPWSTPEQHDADLEFVELDVPVKKIWSILEGNNSEYSLQPPKVS